MSLKQHVRKVLSLLPSYGEKTKQLRPKESHDLSKYLYRPNEYSAEHFILST